ncbi:hypothetical protein [Actinotignum sp. GS-2025b]|nr:hypothetical protein [Actinotignum timonense]PLB83774.1 hypothetical protein CYJ16_07055 [Actinotignum timonense]
MTTRRQAAQRGASKAAEIIANPGQRVSAKKRRSGEIAMLRANLKMEIQMQKRLREQKDFFTF